MRYPGHEFASPILASRRPGAAIDRPVWGARARGLGAVAAAALLLATSGCTWFGFLSGGKNGAVATDAQPAAPAQAPDELTATRARMQAAPREPYWPFHLAELHQAADSTSQAVTQLVAALALDPSYAPAASLLASIYYDAGMHAQAITLLEDFVARNPASPDAIRAALALSYEAMGDIDRARGALASCATGSRDAHAARLLVSLRGGDPKEALANAKAALDADPKSAANQNNYGIALLCAGRPAEARDAFEKALDLEKKLPGALYNLAIVETFYFFDERAGREWFTRYQQVASADPDNLSAHFDADVTRKSPPQN